MKKIVKYLLLIIFFVLTFTNSLLCLNAKTNENIYTLSIDFSKYSTFYAFSGTINYDSNIFEILEKDNFDNNDVEIIDFNKENHKFAVVFNNKKVLTIKFKIKDNVHTNSTIITLKNIIGSNGEKEEKLDDKNYELKILKNNKTKFIKEFDTKNNENQNNKNVLFFNPISVLISIVFIALIYWFNVNFNGFKNKILRVFVNVLFIIGLIISITISFMSYFNKSDINNDVKIDYNDVSEVIEYLLDIKSSNLDLSFGFKADINNDKKLTISDVAKTSKNINSYDVYLNDIRIPKYVEKETQFDIIFKAKITLGETLDKIIINDNEYGVTKINDNEYKVKLTSPNKSGVYNINISKFILSNGKRVNESNDEYNLSIDVLKSIPTLTDYKYDSFNNLILFNLNDLDNSIIKSQIIFKSNNKNVYITDINRGENQVLATLKNGKYKVYAVINYDLDSNIDDENNYELELINKEINVLNDYNFKFHNLKLESVNDKDKIISISFTSTNASTYNIKKVKINKEYYNVKQQNDKYVVDVNYLSKNDVNINIESAVLENEKEFIINEHLSLFKNKPSISNLELKLDNGVLSASYNILDNDKVIRKLYAILKDNSGNIIEQKEVTIDSTFVKFNKKLVYASNYIVEIVSDYNNYDGEVHEKEILTTSNFKIDESVNVESSVNNYVNKNTNFKIKYKIVDNINEEIKFLYINDEKYEVNYVNDTYVVEFNSGDTPKILTYKLNKIEYANGLIVNIDHVDNIEVLKDKIKVENFTFEDNLKYPKIHFSIKDNDNAFVSGRVIVFDEKNKLYFSTNIDLNKTSYELKITDNKNYKLKIEINYILDQNNNEKYNKTEYVFESNIKHITNYDFKILKEKISIDKDKNIATISFDSTNSSKYNIESVNINGSSYKVSRNKNSYKVDIKLNTNTYQTLKLESVRLQNGKVFDNINISFDIYKTKPHVYNFESKVNNSNIEVKFDIKDELNTINSNKVYVLLKDYNNKIIKENELILTKDKTNITTTFENINAGKYIIDINSSFDLMDGKKHIKENIYEENNIEIEVLSTIKTINISNYYPKKGEKIIIKYDIKANSNKEVSALVINSKIYNVKKEKDGYSVILNAPNKSGIYEYKVSKIYFDKLESETVNIDKIDVLKLSPIIKNYTFENINGIARFTFDVEDVDNVVNNNLYALVGNERININVGNNELEFSNLNDKENLEFNVEFNSDLSSGKLDKKYESSKNIIFTKPFDMKNNNYKITNLKSLKKYYKKNEKISLSFEYKSNSKYYPLELIINEKVYAINKNNGKYISTIDGTEFVGENILEGVKIKLNNGQIIDVANEVDFEILKSIPFIKNFTYELVENKVHIKFKLIDEDNSLIVPPFIKITDEKSKTILKEEISQGENDIEFDKNNINNFKVEIISSYDLDTFDDEKNKYKNDIIYENNISFTNRYIELKNIDEVELYYEDDGKIKNATKIDINKLDNLENFIVKITMKDLPYIYSKIDSYEINNNKIIFNLKLDGVIQYENNEVINIDNLQVIFGDIKDNTVYKKDYYKNDYSESLNNVIDYDRIKVLDNYDSKKENIYYNLYKLMPFIDSKYIVEDASGISEDDILNKHLIKAIIPYDKNDRMVNYLTPTTYKNLSYIKVVFDSNDVRKYNLTYDNYKSGVVSYKILELNTTYTYNKFVINDKANVINTLTDYGYKLNYNYDLDIISKVSDSSIYTDYYNNVTKNNLKSIVLKILNSEYFLTFENDILNKIIENDLIENDKLKEYIYTYNYYSKFYDFDIGNVNIRDSLLFYNELFGKKTNIDTFIDKIKTSDISTNNTSGFYLNNISNVTGIKTLSEFLEYYINTFDSYDDVNDWFTNNFSGIINEINIDDNIEYKAWYHLKRRPNLILPIINLPKNSGYIISLPSQIIIGSQRVYIKSPNNQKEHDKLVNKINNYSNLIKDFYTHIYNIVDKNSLDRVSDIQIDSNITLNSKGQKEIQNKGFAEEEFHKNFIEEVNMWYETNNKDVMALGDRVIWNNYSILDNFNTFTDKTITNQFNKIFMNSVVLRNKNINFNSELNFNLVNNYSSNQEIVTNYTVDRINSLKNIEKFYNRLFKTIDLLDYIEANAFLTLSASEQANIAMQVYYPNIENDKKDSGELTIKYKKLTENEIKEMNLKNVSDLIENRIILKSNINENYNVFDSHWYQPYNSNGMIEDDVSNYFAYELLGYKGYNDGFINWYNIKSGNNDVDVLKTVTGYESFEDYKLSKYDGIDNLWKEIRINIKNDLNYLINPDEVYNEFVNKLKIDARNNNLINSVNFKKELYYKIKKVSNDFEIDIFSIANSNNSHVIHVSDGKSFIETISNNPSANIILDNDIDLSGYKGSTSIIKTAFSGQLDGNNNKLTGNVIPIFDLISNANIKNLIVEDTNINASYDNVGAFARKIENSTVENVIVKKITINANKNKQVGGFAGYVLNTKLNNVHVVIGKITAGKRTGGLVGYAINNTVIEECSVSASVNSNGSASSVFVGEVYESILDNNYVIGEINVNNNINDIGGFVGYANNSQIRHNFAKVIMNSPKNSGGFVGQVVGKADIQNNISFSSSTKFAYKFDGRSSIDIINSSGYANNYELKDVSGNISSSRHESIKDKIKVINSSSVNEELFINENKLSWSSDIWNFSDVSNGGVPKLKLNDPNNDLSALKEGIVENDIKGYDETIMKE